ncbi:hypothetical protein GG344DRAFT_71092 [Lentinula edodes]|nr:hypothetical protein GG344DRAFT_71092 [Lentinula edodes]
MIRRYEDILTLALTTKTDHSRTVHKPRRLSWYRREAHDYYRYEVDNDGIIQKIVDDPNSNAEEVNTRGRAKTPPPQKGALKQRDDKHASPALLALLREKTCTDKFSESRLRHSWRRSKRASSIVGDTYGPTKLQTTPFRSHTSEGETAWYYSQSPADLDVPLPETPIPRMLGTLYIHRSIQDGGYQIWVWFNRDGRGLGWQSVNLNDEQVAHPKVAERSLKLTAAGKPSWILNSTLTTYRSRSLKRSVSRSIENAAESESSGK